jgi:hypothetical protein
MEYMYFTIRKDSLYFGAHGLSQFGGSHLFSSFKTLTDVENYIHDITLHGINPDTRGYIVLASDGRVRYYDKYGSSTNQVAFNLGESFSWP